MTHTPPRNVIGVHQVDAAGHLLNDVLCVAPGLNVLAGAAPGSDDLGPALRER